MSRPESLEYIRSTYGVPAHPGGRIRYRGSPQGPKVGTIMGANGAHLSVRFDGELIEVPMHPTWEIDYLDASGAPGGAA